MYEISDETGATLFALLFSCFVTLSVTTIGIMGVKLNNARASVNARVLSAVFALILAVIHLIFALVGVKISMLIIVVGLLSILFVLLYYSLLKMKM